MAQEVKNLPAVQETRVRSLGREDPLEEEMATHSSILAWKNPMDRDACQATVPGVTKSQTRLSMHRHSNNINTCFVGLETDPVHHRVRGRESHVNRIQVRLVGEAA